MREISPGRPQLVTTVEAQHVQLERVAHAVEASLNSRAGFSSSSSATYTQCSAG